MKIVGHRGARGLAPENTLVSLLKGLEHHVDELEFDLRTTKDGRVILHHDEHLVDPNGDSHLIEDCTYDDLLAHKPDLATFEEVLETIGHRAVLHVEIKPEASPEPIIKIIKDCLQNGWKPEEFLLASFDRAMLIRFHEEFPKIDMVVGHVWSGVIATYWAKRLGATRLSMNSWWLWRGFITPMSRRGWKLYAYRLDDPVKAKRWEKYGLYAVITDYPDLFDKL